MPNQQNVQVAGQPAPRVAQNNRFFNNVQVGPQAVLQVPAAEVACKQENLPKSRQQLVTTRDGKVTGPYTHGNLAIFLIHGNDTLQDQEILTLQEGLEQNVVTVRDPNTSHLLTIENRSKTALFIQGGDIVKGGTQDRVLPYDLIVPPQSNHMIMALCVEAGRSFPRGNEMSTSFQT